MLRQGLDPAACVCMQLALWWAALENASASVRSGDIFSAFVFLVTNSNSWVGYIQGVNGCCQVRHLQPVFAMLTSAAELLPCCSDGAMPYTMPAIKHAQPLPGYSDAACMHPCSVCCY